MNETSPIKEIKTLLAMSHVASSAGLRHEEPSRLRFGEVAVSLGYIHEIEVDAALAIQRLDALTGRPHRVLGEILVDRGSLTQQQVFEVLDSLVTHAYQQRMQPVEGRLRLGWREPLIGQLAS